MRDSTRSSSLLLTLTAILIAALLLPVAASAEGLPKTKNKLIDPGKSVAGVQLGMSMKQAGRIWKQPMGSSCFDMNMTGKLTCMFEVSSSGANYHTGNISYSGKNKVESLRLRLPTEKKGYADATKLMAKYKTPGKFGSIGLNSTAAKLRKGFGSALKVVYRKGSVTVYQYRGPKTAKTDFIVDGGKAGRVVTIEIYLGKSQY